MDILLKVISSIAAIAKIIKIATLAIADSLTHISVLDAWKIARVIPLSTKRILYSQLYNYLTEFGLVLLSSVQFGFRKSHSTKTALLDCTSEWYVQGRSDQVCVGSVTTDKIQVNTRKVLM